MLSGLFRKIVFIALALTGLLMLCIPTSEAAEKPVLAIYLTNAGMHLSLGSSSSDEPLYQRSLNTWDSADLYGHPPNIMYNDSPLRLFRQGIVEAAPDLRKYLDQPVFRGQPLQVYIGAAGADAASQLSTPSSSILNDLLTYEQTRDCLEQGLKRKAFFQCVFHHEILSKLIRKPFEQHYPDESRINVVLEQDVNLIAAMAGIHTGTLDSDQPSLVVQSTTLSQPYLVQRGRAVELEGPWMPKGMHDHGGILQVGKLFRELLISTASGSADGRVALRTIIERTPEAANHPKGARANLQRLQENAKGYNNFGHIVGKTANGLYRDRVDLSGLQKQEETYRLARTTAQTLVGQARDSFVKLALMLYAKEQHRFVRQTPRLIVVGEEAEIMFSNTDLMKSVAQSVIGKLEPGTLPADSKTREQLSNQRSRELFENAIMLPSSKFSARQHQAAVHLLNQPVSKK